MRDGSTMLNAKASYSWLVCAHHKSMVAHVPRSGLFIRTLRAPRARPAAQLSHSSAASGCWGRLKAWLKEQPPLPAVPGAVILGRELDRHLANQRLGPRRLLLIFDVYDVPSPSPKHPLRLFKTAPALRVYRTLLFSVYSCTVYYRKNRDPCTVYGGDRTGYTVSCGAACLELARVSQTHEGPVTPHAVTKGRRTARRTRPAPPAAACSRAAAAPE